MFALDLRSLTLMAGMTSVVMAFVILMFRRTCPRSVRGIGLWGLAPLSAATSTLFYGLDGLFPELLVVVVANGLLMACCLLFMCGTRRFLGLPTHWRRWGATLLLVLVWHVVFFRFHPDYRLRLLMFTLFLTVMLVHHARLLLPLRQGFASRFTAAVLLLQAVVLLARGSATFWVDLPDTHRLAPSALQSVYVAAYSFSILLVSVGALLMASERVCADFEHLANHDALTGALSRRMALQGAGHAFWRWQNEGRGFALLMLDVDDFKQINDRHGHQCGDRVLQSVVAALRPQLRAGDHLGRYGGEEFLVVLPDTGMEAALRVAERMRAAVAAYRPEPDLPACTISIGVATVGPGDSDLNAALARADAALYDAKRQGRDRVVPAVALA